jgi:hypothetical protein
MPFKLILYSSVSTYISEVDQLSKSVFVIERDSRSLLQVTRPRDVAVANFKQTVQL